LPDLLDPRPTTRQMPIQGRWRTPKLMRHLARRHGAGCQHFLGRSDLGFVKRRGTTTTATTRAAAATACARVRSVGIDSEVLLGGEQVGELGSLIGSHEEIRRAASAFGCRRLGATVLFSAKESLFKCLFPIVSVMFDFPDVQLIDADAGQETIELELRRALGAEFASGWRAVGAVRLGLPYVHTG
jgi:enterobactin synthetase component D